MHFVLFHMQPGAMGDAEVNASELFPSSVACFIAVLDTELKPEVDFKPFRL